MGLLPAELHRARYYRRVLGTWQTIKMYAAIASRLKTVALRPPGIDHTVLCRPYDADRFTLCHVFYEHDAEVPLIAEPQLIVDAGANVGYVSAYYASRYPRAEIVAIEPDEENFALAKANTARYPQVRLLRAGLWPHDGLLDVRDPTEGTWMGWGRQTAEVPSRGHGTVEGICIETLLKRLDRTKIDVLKLDIEGAEIPLFEHRAEWLGRVGVVLIETHGERAETIVKRAMREAGFEQVAEGHRLVFVNPAHEMASSGTAI